MPYIKQEDRNELDALILSLANKVYDRDKVSPGFKAGALNYINCKLFLVLFEKRYFGFCLFVGTLVCTILEVYRRVVAGYEDEKAKDEGDVF